MNMKAEGHYQKATELKASLEKISETKEYDKDVALIVEIIYGLIQHLIAYKLESVYEIHNDTHAGLFKLLREKGETEISVLFNRLETFRHGRWYGGKGNGEVVEESLKILKSIGNNSKLFYLLPDASCVSPFPATQQDTARAYLRVSWYRRVFERNLI
ncbi:MAG: hypothetical protein QF682_03360 [Candidatus Thermoplasmatota archaeon]|jgi:hypothetical protein|nr:hypothetical protein [Candidatus Thermoplasmatota archaeon]